MTRDLSALIQSIAVASQEFDKTLAKDAFGLGRAALMARSDRKRQAPMGLIWTLVQERSAEKFHDLGAMAQSFNAAALAVRQSAQLANRRMVRTPRFFVEGRHENQLNNPLNSAKIAEYSSNGIAICITIKVGELTALIFGLRHEGNCDGKINS